MTKKKVHWSLTALVAVLALACTSGLGYAAVVTFDNGPGVTGDNAPWEEPTNWDIDALPGPDDDAVVPFRLPGNTNDNVRVGADVGTIKSLQIGGDGGGEQVQVFTNGSLIVTGDVLLGRVDEDGTNRSGELRTQQDTAFLEVNGDIVANSTAANDVRINRGEFRLAGDIIQGDNRIDEIEVERGDFLLTGSGPQTLSAQRFRVAVSGGDQDADFVLATDKTLITTNAGDINDIGRTTESGANVDVNRGIFQIQGGTATFAGALRVGSVADGGTMSLAEGQIIVGNGGTLTANNGLRMALGNDDNASGLDPTQIGKIEVNGSESTVTVAGGIRMAETDPQTEATITINDGLFRLTSGDITTGDDVGTGTSKIILNGGTFDLAGTDALSRVVTEYSHADGATLKVVLLPVIAALEATTMTLASSTSSGGSLIDLDASPEATNATVTWDGGTETWDTVATKWNPDILPANGTVIRQNDQITILSGSIANAANAKLHSSDTADWDILTSSTSVQVKRTGADLVLGPAVAVIDNSASIVTRDSDLNIQFAAGEGADASRLDISDGSLTLSGTNNLILGAGPGQGDVNQSGTSTVTVGGTLQFGSAAGDSGGVYTVGTGSTLDVQGNVGGKSILLADPDVATATLIIDGGTLNTAAGVEINRVIVGDENDAALTISDSTFSARSDDQNQLIANAAGVTASLTISGAAEVTFGDADELSGGEVRIGAGGDNTTTGTVTLSGTATVDVYGGNTEVGVNGNGTLDIQGGTWTQHTNNLVIGQDNNANNSNAVGTFTMSAGVYDLRPSFANTGTDGDFNFNGSDVTNAIPSTATLTGGEMWVGDDIQLVNGDNEDSSEWSILTIDGAVLNVADDINYRNGDNNAKDTINLKSGALVFSPEMEPEDGVNSINAGATGTDEVNQFNWTGGTLSGLEEFNGLDLKQKASDAPSLLQIGSSAGTMTIGDNYLLDAGDNTLEIELLAQGTTAGTDFDLLTVTGTATLAGSIDVLDASEGAIDTGMAFEWNVVEADEITLVGTVNLPTGFEFRVVDDFGEGETDILQIFLEGSMGITGDYNNSGQVEQADLDLVLLNWGKTTPPIPGGWENDLPEGQIDQAELDKVLLNWGNSSGAAAAVPEPATGLMLILGMVVVLVRRKMVVA